MNQNHDRLPVTGRFVRYQDVDYRLQHQIDKWWITSNHAVDESFVQKDRRTFVKELTHHDVLECHDLARPGTYRGMSVEVRTDTPQGHVVTTRDPRAHVEGFERADHRSPLEKLIAFDDSELRFTTTVTPVPMPWKIAHDWERFGERLADTFRHVTDGVFLIVHAAADPRRYVQFAGAPDRLDAEAPATDVVADADESPLRWNDWVAPDVWQPNWTSSLGRPAVMAEVVQLARRCTAALHKAYGITSPDELRYRAWHEPLGAPAATLELPSLGLG